VKVLLGTTNPGKLQEILALLGDVPGLEWVNPKELGLPEVRETGATLEENARLKAQTLAQWSGLAALAEDSGLEVEALDGAPGVHTATFAGTRDPQANIARLLRLLEGAPNRRARFRAVACLALPEGSLWTSEGLVEGHIAEAPRGSGGFGYDPVFIPEGETRTLAEMTLEEKNRVSHRGKAVMGLRLILAELGQRGESPKGYNSRPKGLW